MLRYFIAIFALLTMPPSIAGEPADIESKWLALIVEDLSAETQRGCSYSFDEVTDNWIALTGARFETWHFTVCGEAMTYAVSYYPEDPPSGKDEVIEIERESGD